MKFLRKILGIKSAEEKRLLQQQWEELKIRVRNRVANQTVPAVHLIKSPISTNSKLGGKPIVDPLDFEWPMSGGCHMTFLAQLDLSQITQQFEYDWLPRNGMVLFFYDMKEMPWGYDPKDKEKWKVIYQEHASTAVDTPSDLDNKHVLAEKFLTARKIEVLPSFDSPAIESLNLSDKEIDFYIEIGEHFEEFNCHADFPVHQVGGLPSPIQGDVMQFEAKMASSGVYMGDSKATQNATKDDYEKATSEWALLFQFDSDDEVNAMWGDLGRLYFWVEKDRAKVKDFSNSWLVLQCS